ncbi:MAG: RAMP superfamily CRISPR-associated protein [Peptococcaceae bacterium]
MIHDYYLQEIHVAKKREEMFKTKEKDIDYQLFYPRDGDFNRLQQYLPQNSTLIKISFTLKKPYTSKDDGEFHIIHVNGRTKIFENPIVRDKHTGLPMVKPSTWKGHLRFAAERVERDDGAEKEKTIRRLFGSETAESEALRGRLYFFPTFFEELSEKDVITPLERSSRTPRRGPIELEIIGADKKGVLQLLYFPYPKGSYYTDKEVEEDLKFLADSLKLMLYTYGFSAKKTSGFGVINNLQGQDIEITPEGFKKYFSVLYNNSQDKAGGGA